MKAMWEKLKVKWDIQSDKRMAWIFIIFALTGSYIGFIRRPLTMALFQKTTYGELIWYELLLTVVIVYFIYQIVLFSIGSLLG